MKKKRESVAIAAFVLVGYLSVHPAYAQGLCPPGQFGSLCTIKVENTGVTIGGIIQLLLVIAIVLSLFFLVFGGIRYISSGGDKGKVDQARAGITAALIGLVISLLGYFIIGVILNFFTGQGLSNLSIPTLLQ